VDDLFAIDEEPRQRFELIEGVIEERGAPSAEHGGSQQKIAAYIDPFGRKPGRRWPGGWWFATETDVYFDPANTFRPDVAGWRRERVPEQPKGALVKIRPDWVCEVLSTNRKNDLVKKKRVYHRHQVPHYWVIDPVEESLAVLRWTEGGYLEVLSAERGDTVAAEPFEAIPLHVGVLFGDDPPDDEG
jgi:Uma2 family endonuclease